MNELQTEVSRMADEAFEMVRALTGKVLDFSEASLGVVEDALAQASAHVGELTEDQATKLVQRLGCYVLEVMRRRFGGTYQWYGERSQPMLVVGEPDYHVAVLGWDRVRGRLSGNRADSIPLFHEVFAQRVRSARPGAQAIYG